MVQEWRHQEDENANLELSCVRSIFLCSLSHSVLKCAAVIKQFGGGGGAGGAWVVRGSSILNLSASACEEHYPLNKTLSS